jgi:hypothetical protein
VIFPPGLLKLATKPNLSGSAPRGLEVDDQLEFGRLLDRDVTRLRAAKNLIDQLSGAAEQKRDICSV